jgi:hypothetical protein
MSKTEIVWTDNIDLSTHPDTMRIDLYWRGKSISALVAPTEKGWQKAQAGEVLNTMMEKLK